MMEASIDITTNVTSKSFGRFAHYMITEPLGDKHLYPVYHASLKESTDTFVIKLMDVDDESFINECRVFALPEHRNIIKPKELLTNTAIEFGSELAPANSLKACNFEIPKNGIVMELVENGDLFNYLLQGPLPDRVVRCLFDQILDSVEHLHFNNICHLDLKPENILLDKDFKIKLTDFGFASQVQKDLPLYKKVGTPSCRPPEMWKFGPEFLGYDGFKADIFQLGNLLFTMISGTPAFTEAHSADFWYKPVLAGRWDVFWGFKERAGKNRKQGAKTYDSDFKTLISDILAVDQTSRPTIEAIRKSAWYSKVEPATELEVAAELKKRKAQLK